jgi:hypothetical protein
MYADKWVNEGGTVWKWHLDTCMGAGGYRDVGSIYHRDLGIPCEKVPGWALLGCYQKVEGDR